MTADRCIEGTVELLEFDLHRTVSQNGTCVREEVKFISLVLIGNKNCRAKKFLESIHYSVVIWSPSIGGEVQRN